DAGRGRTHAFARVVGGGAHACRRRGAPDPSVLGCLFRLKGQEHAWHADVSNLLPPEIGRTFDCFSSNADAISNPPIRFLAENVRRAAGATMARGTAHAQAAGPLCAR